MESTPRFFEPPEGSFFLFGPRGTGKSTWLRQRLQLALVIDLLDPVAFRNYSARPERLMEVTRAAPPTTDVIIDEVQKVPELLDAVHLIMEEDPRRRFVLTGSSARKLRRSGVDLLAGRAVRRALHPYMAAELGAAFTLDSALTRGLVPLVLGARQPADTLASYVSLYLREEVQVEGLVRNGSAFSRFLEAVSFSHAGVLSVSAVARDASVERKTVEGYLGVLEDLLLGYRLMPFTKRAKRAMIAHPKLYLFDAGVFRSLRPAGPLDRPSEIDGAALEGLVAQHLRAWIDYRQAGDGLWFWQTRGGSEVDFVVYGPQTFVALEVKNTASVRPEDLGGLRAFRADYPEASAVLLYRGTETLEKGGIRCVPVEAFLRALHPREALVAACGGG